VLFPDGDDPDSYAKKVSTQELTAYIENNSKDFITFKSNVLLSETGNDPIKKADLIKGILQSIAVIPDAISRTLFLKECAHLFDMEEHILTGELNKLRIDKLRGEQGASITLERDKKIEHQSLETERREEKKDLLVDAEKEVMRIMVKYGRHVVETEQINPENQTETIETTVAELIIHELEKDDIEMQSPVLQKIYNKFKLGIENSTLYGPKSFLNDEDQRVVAFIADVESVEYAISNNWFNRYRIEVKSEEQKLQKAVLNAIYELKRMFIEREIDRLDSRMQKFEPENADELTTMLLTEKINFLKVRKAIDGVLGRI
jgi:DNA primase